MDAKYEIRALLGEARQETKAVVTAVFKIEREKLYQERPIGLREDVVAAIRGIVK